jgi:hypothetical protein
LGEKLGGCTIGIMNATSIIIFACDGEKGVV